MSFNLAAELAKQEYAAAISAQNWDAIAAAVNAHAYPIGKPYSATIRSLMGDLGPVLANTILTKLEAAAPGNAILARSLTLLEPAQGGLDLDHPATQAQMDALQGAGVLTAEEVAALKALALQPLVVTNYECRLAMGQG